VQISFKRIYATSFADEQKLFGFKSKKMFLLKTLNFISQHSTSKNKRCRHNEILSTKVER